MDAPFYEQPDGPVPFAGQQRLPAPKVRSARGMAGRFEDAGGVPNGPAGITACLLRALARSGRVIAGSKRITGTGTRTILVRAGQQCGFSSFCERGAKSQLTEAPPQMAPVPDHYSWARASSTWRVMR